MMTPIRKRIFIVICIIGIVVLLIRYLLHNQEILTTVSDYKRPQSIPVLVTVYYETLCIDSKHFITKQLLPTFKKAAPLMEIQLVPYGKAHTYANDDGTFRFDCQHGPAECQGNIYHACAIEAIEDPHIRLNMITCMIKDNRLPKEAMHKCAKTYNVENTDLIQKCYDSNHGNELLNLNGEATHALRPSINFIPTITLDGSQGRQAAILKNLLGEICKIVGDNEKAHSICKDES